MGQGGRFFPISFKNNCGVSSVGVFAAGVEGVFVVGSASCLLKKCAVVPLILYQGFLATSQMTTISSPLA